MELTVSRPIKILALVLVVAGVGGIASLQLLGKSSSGTGSSTPLSVAQIRARAHPHAAPAAHAARTHAAAPTRTAAAQPKPKPAPKPAVRAPRPTVAKNGLPIILDDALRQHRVVVVSVFDPQAPTDAYSYAEARAGASASGSGFLGVSVLDDSVAGPLTAALPGGGLLPVPGVLVYRRPGTLVQFVDGFADRDSIAQLAVSALTAPPLTSTSASSAAAAPTTSVPVAPPPAPATTTP